MGWPMRPALPVQGCIHCRPGRLCEYHKASNNPQACCEPTPDRGSHESYVSAVKAAETRETKTRAYLRLLARRGPVTDHESASALGYPLSSICSIRNGAIVCGLVERGGYAKPSPYGGNKCRVWQLTDAGRAAVSRMEI